MKEYGISFGRTEAAILVLSFVFMYVVITGSGLVPSAYFLIYLGVSPILGILYGPYAAIGAMLATLVTDYPEVAPVDICWDMLLTGATAIVPYKIWYSCFPNCGSRQPDLMSYRNTVKFIGCILAGAVIGTLLLDGFWIMRYGMDPVNDSAIISFLNLTGFSVLIGLTAIVIFRFFGIPFYGPRRRALHSILDRPNHRLYDLIILAAFLIILNSDWTADRDIAETGLTVSMVLVYLYVLLKPSYTVEPVPRSSVKLNRFDRSAIERVVLILLAEGLILCLLFLLASHYGIINNISNWNSQSSLLFYLNVALLMFFFPLLALLWYIENYLTKPIGFIAEEVRNYIGVDGVRGTMDLSSGRIGRSAEIGNLAMSIESMSEDLDRYIEDIKSLSAEKERYGAELSIASGIQLSLIPKEFDSVGDRANVAGVMQPAKYVGGDLYDFFPVDEDRLAIVIADVSGKGMPAALFMAITKILIEEHARPGVEPGTVLSEVNRSLCKNNDELMFVTVWV
ncbi:MAG: SpoIIE family protein phosphatase, partial [Thermoplasmata archaeon]|nr:SpoIIE family protein phosphatase [Thermoplasmata archaeon]